MKPLKTKDYQDFIDFAYILKKFYGIQKGEVLNQKEFALMLFENICDADIDECISYDPDTLASYLSKRSIYPNVSTVLLSSLNKGKFKRWITNKDITDDALMALLKELEAFLNRCPRFDDTSSDLLKLCTLETVGEFAAEIFIKILSAPDGAKVVRTQYITERSKSAIQHFIGRTTDLDDMKKWLEADKPQKIWVHGMGGLGKTQLCRKLIYDLDGQFPLMGWVVFDGNLKQSFVNQIKCEKDTTDTEKAYQDTIAFINRRGSGLVLFIDNLDAAGTNIADLEKLNCHVIVTSRNAAPNTFTEKVLGFLSLTECKTLFYSHYEREKDDAVNEVIHMAGYLTLAVELLARTAAAIDVSIEELHAKLTEKSFDLRTAIETNWDNDAEAQNKAISIQFGIVFSFSGIKDNEDYIYVLKNMAILPYLPTRQKVLCEWLGLDDESDVFRKLHASGWLQYSTEYGYLMHSVISYTVKAELKPAFEDCGKLANSLAKKISFTGIKSAFDVLEYAPYAQSLIDYLLDIVESTHEKLQPFLPFLCVRLATLFSENNELETALRYGRKAHHIAEKTNGMEHYLLADMYNTLAEICMDSINTYEEGIRYSELAIQAAELSGELRPQFLSTTYQTLAWLLAQKEEDLSGALEAASKAAEIYTAPDADSAAAQAVNIYRLLSFIFVKTGDYVGASESMERCIPIIEHIYKNNPSHPTLAVTYRNYAQIICNIPERLDDAISYLRKAIKIRESNNPSDCRIASLENMVAKVHIEKGEYSLASDHLTAAICILANAQYSDIPYLSNTFFLMGKIYFLSGDYSQAIFYARKSIMPNASMQDELASRCLICRCLDYLEQSEATKHEIEQMIAFIDTNGVDPTGVENYAECMEIYTKVTEVTGMDTP